MIDSFICSMDYGAISLDLSYFCTSVLLVIVGVTMKAVLEKTVVHQFIGLGMRVYSVTVIEKVSTLIVPQL